MANALSPFLILVIAGILLRLSYHMARSPVLPRFAQDLGSSLELIGQSLNFWRYLQCSLPLPSKIRPQQHPRNLDQIQVRLR